ncbi:MAG TPA: hypothetical protein VLJ42_12180 [Solirubrobacteraceae bacterium]|nr:hypothetical protein [Solirubrobacteraceae bacterium]
MRIQIAIAAGLALAALVVGLTLSRSPTMIAGTNSISQETLLAAGSDFTVCQNNETLPRGASAIRLWLGATIGPRVAVDVLAGARTVAHGTRAAGWTGVVVTVPLRPVARAAALVRVCAELDRADEPVGVQGQKTGAAMAATSGENALPGRMRIEYLRAGERSWWSLARPIVRRMGLGHAWSGGWIVLVLLALLLGIGALTSWSLLREPL